MEGDVQYVGSIPNQYSHLMYQVPETFTSRTGYAAIEFSECIGDTELMFVEDSNKADKTSALDYTSYTQFGRTTYFVSLPKTGLFVVVKPKVFTKDESL